MKVTVNRQLSGGRYYVAFRTGEFSTEELQKMQSFGVPPIMLTVQAPGGGRLAQQQPVTQISEQLKAVFSTEDEAKKYEQRVLNDIRGAMQTLRERRDEFTSSQEVDI